MSGIYGYSGWFNITFKAFYEKEEYRSDDNYLRYQNLFSLLETDFVNTFHRATEYSKRFDKITGINDIMERLLFCIKHPEFLGKSTMVTAVFNNSIYEKSMRNVLQEDNLSFLDKLGTIPTFFLLNVNFIEFENNAEKRINLRKEDASYLIKRMGKKLIFLNYLACALLASNPHLKIW